jgi:hypothetical protein
MREAYLGSILDRAEVDDCEIRIVGRKNVVEQAVLANGAPCQGFAACTQMARPEGALSNKLFRVLRDWNTYLMKRSIREGLVYEDLPAPEALLSLRDNLLWILCMPGDRAREKANHLTANHRGDNIRRALARQSAGLIARSGPARKPVIKMLFCDPQHDARDHNWRSGRWGEEVGNVRKSLRPPATTFVSHSKSQSERACCAEQGAASWQHSEILASASRLVAPRRGLVVSTALASGKTIG